MQMEGLIGPLLKIPRITPACSTMKLLNETANFEKQYVDTIVIKDQDCMPCKHCLDYTYSLRGR